MEPRRRMTPVIRVVIVALIGSALLIGALFAQRRRASPALPADRIVDLHLRLDDRALASLRRNPDLDVPGRLTVDGRSRQTFDVSVRLKGQQGSKRSVDDKPALKVEVLNGGHVLGREELTLNNMVQDPTMVREALGYQVYADAGVHVPDTAYVRLSINEEPRGLYLLVDSIDRQFLRRRFGNDTGILYEAAYGTDFRQRDLQKFELDEGADPERAALARLIRGVEARGDDVFYGSDASIDMPSFVAMMAVQVTIADWDNYYRSNNYRIYWEPGARRWFFIPTGLDQAFTEHPIQVTVSGRRATGVLFRKCLESDRCRQDYLAGVRAAADRFEQMRLEERMDRLVTLIGDASRADSKKPHTTERIEAARSALRTFIARRPDEVRAQVEAMRR